MISADDAMRQAPPTIREYLAKGVEIIDREMGKGYAAKHPNLLGCFVIACALDYFACRNENAMELLGENFKSGLEEAVSSWIEYREQNE